MEKFNRKCGWIRQKPSEKDREINHPANVKLLKAIRDARATLPRSVDLSSSDVPVVDQQQLGSCPANALAGLLGWYIKKNNGMIYVASRLFTYYYTRILEGSPIDQDTGTTIRGALGSLALFGVPPEKSSLQGIAWDYEDYKTKFTQAPPMMTSFVALNYQGVAYTLIDKPGTPDVLGTIKGVLAAGLPMEFGFDCFESIVQADQNGGAFPVPTSDEQVVAGHAVEAVGYDDNYITTNTTDNSKSTGALFIKNSWGETWGIKGYGYLPYWYVQNGHASDFWTLTDAKFLDPDQFAWSA
jgi:C1A family cysteine protease